MKYIIITILLTVSLLSSECSKVFPDVFSSQTSIVFNSRVDAESVSDVLQTPILYQSHPSSKCNGKKCKESQTKVDSLEIFTSNPSLASEYITIDKDTTLSDEELGNVVVTGDNVTLTFKAPLPAKGFTPTQKIGFIEIKGKNITLEFEAGDYYMESFEAISSVEKPKIKKILRDDTLSIIPKGNTRLFIEKTFYISKKGFNPADKTIAINTKTETKTKKLFGFITTSKKEVSDTKKLIIYSKGTIEINTPNVYEINALIYGYENIKMISNSRSSFKGALHAKGELIIDTTRGNKAGKFIYDEEAVTDLYKMYTCQALPNEVDEKLNNSTLLGIDSNNNGIRDDVEIYVIKRYAQDPDFPKTKTALAMQYAWASQKILENPVLESKKYSDDAIDCQFYWINNKRKNMSTLDGLRYSVKHKVFNDSNTKDRIYNTRERIEQKFSYNAALSGNIFDGRRGSIDNCQVNIDELGE